MRIQKVHWLEKKCLFALLACLISVAQLIAAEVPGDDAKFEISATKYLLGTKIDLLVLHTKVSEARKACYLAFREIERIETVLSSHLDDSEIARLNKAAGRRAVKISDETMAILQRAKSYSAQLDGLFDISIGALTELWGFSSDHEVRLPDFDRLTALRRAAGFQKIVLNNADTTAFLSDSLLQIDLGGIAKGYAIDRAASVLREQGIDHFLINAGGDILTSGHKSDGKDWLVGVKHPRKADALLAKFPLTDQAVATSGDYERFAIIDGKRYHHILDPQTGFPADSCQSVTVIASTAEQADVWATYLFVLGPSRFQRAVAAGEVQAMLVDARGEILLEPNFAKRSGLELMQ